MKELSQVKKLNEEYKDGNNAIFINGISKNIRDLNGIFYSLTSIINLTKDSAISKKAKEDLSWIFSQTFIGIAKGWSKNILIEEDKIKKSTDIKSIDFVLLDETGKIKIYWK